MSAPLRVTVESMRETADGLEDLAVRFIHDGGGSAISAAAVPAYGLDSGSACYDVGSAFQRYAQTLGCAAKVFADKLDTGAFLYQHGDSAAAERIEFDPPEKEEERVGDDPGEPGYDPANEYEDALHDAGLLDGPSSGFYREWLENAAKNGVPPEVIVDIARAQNITPKSFDVLTRMERVTDQDGKDFFLLPEDATNDEAFRATLMTYILNAGTGYGNAKGRQKNDFAETPYTADEVQRIQERQLANAWSYNQVERLSERGGRFATTPNGMLIGLGVGQTWGEEQLSQRGGTTLGDIFIVNNDHPADAAQSLRDYILKFDATGRDLDRVLHHEERHSQQWADLGFARMVEQYAITMGIEWTRGPQSPFEKNAGSTDGGY